LIDAAESVEDLRTLPGNRLERLIASGGAVGAHVTELGAELLGQTAASSVAFYAPGFQPVSTTLALACLFVAISFWRAASATDSLVTCGLLHCGILMLSSGCWRLKKSVNAWSECSEGTYAKTADK
jgi:hypothetical protein